MTDFHDDAPARVEALAFADGVAIAQRPALGRPRHEEGLYALTKLAKDLPEGPALDMIRDVIRRPWRAALATVLIAAQLGSRSSWSGADELQSIGEVLDGAGLPLGNHALYRAIADQFGIEHDDEDEYADEEEG